MGSFSYTCCISGLPIEAGDPVRYFLLTQNPYNDSPICYMHSLWFPRNFPLKAEYNDYGSVENIQSGPLKDIWMEGFQKDLIEKGWGDNSCHDVPVSKDMSFDDLLNAITENRVYVRRDMDDKTASLKASGYKLPAGIPTRKRVEKAIINAGFPIYKEGQQYGMMVNKVRNGEVRIRFQSWGDEYGKDVEYLEKIKACLAEYAIMISAGTGQSAHLAEMLVRPKPGTDGFYGVSKSKNSPLQINHAMIREDVWQALIKLSINDYKNLYSIEDYRTGIKKTYNKYIKSSKDEYRFIDLFNKKGYYGSQYVTQDTVPFTCGLAFHWKLLLEKNKIPYDVFDTIAEFAFIHDILMSVRHWWHPSYSVGPQCGEWNEHVTFQKTILGIAKKISKKNKLLYGIE